MSLLNSNALKSPCNFNFNFKSSWKHKISRIVCNLWQQFLRPPETVRFVCVPFWRLLHVVFRSACWHVWLWPRPAILPLMATRLRIMWVEHQQGRRSRGHGFSAFWGRVHASLYNLHNLRYATMAPYPVPVSDQPAVSDCGRISFALVWCTGTI